MLTSRIAPVCVIGTLLASCTSLNLLHDPQTGVIGRDQIPGFLKSVRCELKTFYEANWWRQRQYRNALGDNDILIARARKTNNKVLLNNALQQRRQAIQRYPHFTLSDELFGGVFLDLKVVDTLGVGTGDTNVVRKHVFDSTKSQTWAFNPQANTQNTYDMNLSFIIDQKFGLANATNNDEFGCYSVAWQSMPGATPDDFAKGRFPETQQFTRIMVNGVTPFAAWLLDNSEQVWVNFKAVTPAAESEQLVPVQMNYLFSVQITAGLDVRYSLTSPVWSPAQIGGIASTVQTSQLQLYFNGVDAQLAGGTKTGTAINALAGEKPRNVPIGEIERLKVLLAANGRERNRNADRSKNLDMKSIQGMTLDEQKRLPPDVKELVDEKIRLDRERLRLERQLRAATTTPRRVGPAQSRGYLLYPPALPNP
jgi:hypothetical protein